jgi:hypothetical protein
VSFMRGDVVFAASDVRRLQLGARLVACGLVDAEQLRTLVAAQRTSGAALVDVLTGATSPFRRDEDREVVADVMREQIQDGVFDLLRVANGRFEFESRTAGDASPAVLLRVEDLVEEGLRRLEEWEDLKERIPDLGTVLALQHALHTAEVTIASDEWRLLTLVDGKRSVADLVSVIGRGEYATVRRLAHLVDRGVVHVVRPGVSTALGETLSRWQTLCRLEETELVQPGPGRPPADPAPAPIHPPADSDFSAPFVVAPPERVEAAAGEAPTTAPVTELHPRVGAPVEAVTSSDESDTGALLRALVEPDGDDPLPFGEPLGTGTTVAEHSSGDAHAGAKAEPLDPRSAPMWAADDESRGPAGAPTDAPEGGHAERGPAGTVPSESTPVSAVDRAQVARELASLGLEQELAHDRSAVSAVPAPAEAPAHARPHAPVKHDQEMSRGLLLRLIEGVKGA